MKAVYKIVQSSPLIIRDVGKGMTVTNDIEAVVENLVREGRLRSDILTSFQYYDSEGVLDTVVVEHGVFSHFSLG